MIGAIVQARMSSSRYPGKVLADIVGKTTIQRVVDRLSLSSTIDRIVVATSSDSTDDELVKYCAANRIDCLRGELLDVLERYHKVVSYLDLNQIVRITADCPLVDAGLVDEIVRFHIEKKADYTSNTSPPSFPDGLDVEVFTREALERAYFSASHPIDREHVTHYIYSNPHEFKVCNFSMNENLSHLRLTLDYPEDLQVIEAVYVRFAPRFDFSLKELLDFVRTDERCLRISEQFSRNASLAAQKQGIK